MEFLLPFLVSGSLLLPSLGLAVSGQEACQLVHLNGPSQTGVHVSVAHKGLPMVASSVLGAESWLRTHVLAHYPSEHITTIVVGCGVTCNHGQELQSLRLSHAIKNLHHSLVRWGLVDDIKVTSASPVCVRDRAVLHRRLYGRHHLPPSATLPPPPGVPLSFAPNYPPEVVPTVPPTSAVSPHSPVSVPASPPPVMSASPPLTMPSTPPTSMPASPPVVAGGMAPSAMPPPCLAPPAAAMSPPPPCLAPPAAAMSPPPWSDEGGNGGALWCVAKPTVPEDKLQEAMDYACSQDGVGCQEIGAGGSCFYPDNIASHASYAFNSYWQKMKQIGGSCNFGGTALLINSDPSYLQCRFMLS